MNNMYGVRGASSILPRPMKAKEEAHKTKTCLLCGRTIFPSPKRRVPKPGCIYSKLGIREYKLTGLCEYCFDKVVLNALGLSKLGGST